MKKILLLTVIAVFVMMPLASFAKTAISDSELGAVTAQTGVTIDFSNLNLTLNPTVAGLTISWGDDNGFTGYASPGWVGAQITNLTNTTVGISGTMDIDVGTNAGTTAIGIKLPATINVGVDEVTMAVKLAADKTLTTTAGTLGTASILNLGLSVGTSGTLAIYAH
ncbi:MAG: DUF6160 family protein [Smithella sp.]